MNRTERENKQFRLACLAVALFAIVLLWLAIKHW